MFAHITCPSCGTMGQFSTLDGSYKGPYRCWKCKSLYSVEIENAKMISCQPMGENELENLKAEQEAKKKGIPYVPPARAAQPAPPAPTPQPATQTAPPPTPAQPHVTPELPKAPVVWPPIPKAPSVNQPKPAPAADPKAMPKSSFMWPPIPKPPPPGQAGKH